FARLLGAHVDIGAYEYLFADNFTGTGALSSNWQRPPLPEKYLFIYRRPGPGFTENNKAISTGTGINTEQAVGLSLLTPTLVGDVDASQALAAGLIARIQSNSDAYAAVLTNAGNAEIWRVNGINQTHTVLATTNAGTNVGTLTFTITGGATPTLLL